MGADNGDGGWFGEDRFRFEWGLRHMLAGRHIMMGCPLWGQRFNSCFINDIGRRGIPLYLGSRDVAQVPWRQNLPSSISLINFFLSKFAIRCVEGYGLAIMATVLLTKREVERKFLTTESNGWVMFLQPRHAEDDIV